MLLACLIHWCFHWDCMCKILTHKDNSDPNIKIDSKIYTFTMWAHKVLHILCQVWYIQLLESTGIVQNHYKWLWLNRICCRQKKKNDKQNEIRFVHSLPFTEAECHCSRESCWYFPAFSQGSLWNAVRLWHPQSKLHGGMLPFPVCHWICCCCRFQ